MNEPPPPNNNHILMAAVVMWLLVVFTGCVIVVMVGQMRGTYQAQIPVEVVELCRLAVVAALGGSAAGIIALIKKRKP